MKKLNVVLMLLFGAIHLSFAQVNHGINWITGMGNSYKVHFRDAVPFVSEFDFNYNYYFKRGSSCVSDFDGSFRLICNGCQLYDSLGIVVEGGDTLIPKGLCNHFSGSIAYAQASIILPLGGSFYSVITSSVSDSLFSNWPNIILPDMQYYDIMQQHIVDMKLNGGHGKVIKKQMLMKDVPLSRTQMMACRHADGKSWWLFKQGKDSNKVYKFVITADSVYDYGWQKFEEPVWGNFDEQGQSMFNHKGTQYVTCAAPKNQIFLADFNRCDGNLTTPRILNPPVNTTTPSIPTIDSFPVGVCFSPNDSFLYVTSNFNIYQYDLFDPDTLTAWYHVANMDTTYDQFLEWYTMYTSPDGRIFLGNKDGVGKAMSTIDNPNVKGAGCNFCPKCFRFGLIGAGNPPCMPNYALGKDTTLNCWPMGLSESESGERAAEWKLYPNPAQTQLTVESEAFKKGLNSLRIFNLMGQCVLEEAFKTLSGKHTVSVQGLPAGVYFMKVNNMVRRVVVE